MLIVAPIFMMVFLIRDVQVLANRDRASWARFASYALLLAVAVALMVGWGDAPPLILRAWTRPTLAWIAVLVQLAESAMGLVLRSFALGRYSWVGCVLPAPAFLLVLFALSFAVRDWFIAASATAAVGIVTTIWLALVGGIVVVLNRLDNPWEDRRFADDFALMTSCTALIFVPFGLL